MPLVRALTVTLPPVPSAPSRLDVQAIAGVRLPSSASLAVPVKVIAARGSNVDSEVGEKMVTVGLASTAMVIARLAVLPAASVTEAVTV